MRIQGSAPLPASVVIRYNFSPDREIPIVGVAMTALFRDNGAGARVVAQLKRVNFTTGRTATLLTFDSDDFAPSADLQAQEVSSCAASLITSNAYFIEATLLKTTGAANPALQAIRIDLINC